MRIRSFQIIIEAFINSSVHFAAFKDPPYLLKECGYAGFELDIDIYFRCQRDEQKKITFRYDLTLPSKGSTSASERRYHTFNNPSSEFKRKLMEGGAQIVYPNTSSNDDRSRDAIEDRTQLLSKPKLGSSSSSGGGSDLKKHKSKSSQDDIVMKPSSTFANLFGTPITKLSNSKQSPEQKISNNSSSSSSINTKLPSSSSAGSGGGVGGGGTSSASAAASASSGNSSKQISQKSSASSSSKDKSDKSSKSKKEKNKVSSSPMKDGKDSTSSKKSTNTSSTGDDKHQRRDDVRKEKSHNKDRERVKDKPSKRPASPKPLAASRSPKRSASPSSRNSSSNRHLTDGPSSASQSILSARHADEKVSISSSSSSTNKKSKKEKRDKSFEKERERGIESKKDNKSMSTLSKLPRDEKPLSKSLEKINGTSKKDRDGGGGSGNSTPKDSIRDKNSSSSTNAKYRQVFDSKIDSPVEPMQKSSTTSSGLERENKKIDKHDGSDRKHKHKKKDKKEKGRSGSKDRKKDKDKVSKAGAKEMIDENSTSSSTNHKRAYGQTPPLHSTHSTSSVRTAASAANLMSAVTTHSKLSDDSSSDFDMDDDYPTTARPSSPPPVKHEKPDVADPMASEQSNMIGLSDAVTKVSPSHRVPLGESPTKQTKKSGKESKSKSLIAAAAVASKEEFQVSEKMSYSFRSDLILFRLLHISREQNPVDRKTIAGDSVNARQLEINCKSMQVNAAVASERHSRRPV